MTSPTVYFIDDSATMREVIKIAFRRENIDVVACHDADAALAQMNEQRPDVVISDVIMPGKDGYEVCQRIKQNPATAGTPVVLMSGVVNKQVAEKAFAVKADELIRKPFQPGDLIGRVRQLLMKSPKPVTAAPVAPVVPIKQAPAPVVVPQMQAQAPTPNAAATLSSIFAAATHRPHGNGNGQAAPMRFGTPAPAAAVAPQVPAAAAAPVAAGVSVGLGASRNGTGLADVAKLKIEILRLEHLVKKLQSEIAAEREYAHALEEHIKTLQETE